MKVTNLEELFHDQLKDLYSAENQLLKALTKMAKKSSSEQLAEGFEAHREETQKQVERLNEIAESLGIKLTGKKCQAMAGLIEEGSEVIEEIDEGPVRDAALVAAAQRVEHYEISAYGTARAMAKLLGYSDAEQLLQETEEEESATDEKLNDLVMKEIYPSIEAEADGEEEEEEEATASRSSRSGNGRATSRSSSRSTSRSTR